MFYIYNNYGLRIRTIIGIEEASKFLGIAVGTIHNSLSKTNDVAATGMYLYSKSKDYETNDGYVDNVRLLSKNKPMCIYEKDGTFVEEVILGEYVEKTGFNMASIIQCAKGSRKQYKGKIYIFKKYGITPTIPVTGRHLYV